jgi:hypothetical protein
MIQWAWAWLTYTRGIRLITGTEDERDVDALARGAAGNQ